MVFADNRLKSKTGCFWCLEAGEPIVSSQWISIAAFLLCEGLLAFNDWQPSTANTAFAPACLHATGEFLEKRRQGRRGEKKKKTNQKKKAAAAAIGGVDVTCSDMFGKAVSFGGAYRGRTNFRSSCASA